MKHPIAVCGHIYWVGVNDYETQIFENLWPLPGCEMKMPEIIFWRSNLKEALQSAG